GRLTAVALRVPPPVEVITGIGVEKKPRLPTPPTGAKLMAVVPLDAPVTFNWSDWCWVALRAMSTATVLLPVPLKPPLALTTLVVEPFCMLRVPPALVVSPETASVEVAPCRLTLPELLKAPLRASDVATFITPALLMVAAPRVPVVELTVPL